MSEKLSGRELIAAVAGPRLWSDTRQSWINRAARRAGVSFRSAKALFYGEISDSRHAVARLMKIAADTKAKGEAGGLATELADRFERFARGLRVQDPDFHRDMVLALIDVARALRGLGRSGNNDK